VISPVRQLAGQPNLKKPTALGGAVGVWDCESSDAETPREELVHAYHLLKTADHDYAGHRAKALGEVETAGKALGLKLEGDLPTKERQWKSDEQITEARRLLQAARDQLEVRDRDRVATHVDIAVKEIDAALKVK
jgi:hypothetical protein